MDFCFGIQSAVRCIVKLIGTEGNLLWSFLLRTIATVTSVQRLQQWDKWVRLEPGCSSNRRLERDYFDLFWTLLFLVGVDWKQRGLKTGVDCFGSLQPAPCWKRRPSSWTRTGNPSPGQGAWRRKARPGPNRKQNVIKNIQKVVSSKCSVILYLAKRIQFSMVSPCFSNFSFELKHKRHWRPETVRIKRNTREL